MSAVQLAQYALSYGANPPRGLLPGYRPPLVSSISGGITLATASEVLFTVRNWEMVLDLDASSSLSGVPSTSWATTISGSDSDWKPALSGSPTIKELVGPYASSTPSNNRHYVLTGLTVDGDWTWRATFAFLYLPSQYDVDKTSGALNYAFTSSGTVAAFYINVSADYNDGGGTTDTVGVYTMYDGSATDTVDLPASFGSVPVEIRDSGTSSMTINTLALGSALDW